MASRKVSQHVKQWAGWATTAEEHVTVHGSLLDRKLRIQWARKLVFYIYFNLLLLFIELKVQHGVAFLLIVVVNSGDLSSRSRPVSSGQSACSSLPRRDYSDCNLELYLVLTLFMSLKDTDVILTSFTARTFAARMKRKKQKWKIFYSAAFSTREHQGFYSMLYLSLPFHLLKVAYPVEGVVLCRRVLILSTP